MKRTVCKFLPLLLVVAANLPLDLSAANSFQGVEANKVDNQFVAVYKFSAPVDPQLVTLEVKEKAAELTISDAEMPSDKNLIKVNEGNIASIFTTLEAEGLMKSKVVFDSNINGLDMKDSVKFVADKNTLSVYVKSPSDVWTGAAATEAPDAIKFVADVFNSTDANEARTAATNGDDKAPEKSEAKEPALGSLASVGAASAQAAETLKNTTNAKLKESEIPVLTGVSAKKVETKSTLGRLIVSMGVIAILALGLIAFSRWYSRSAKVNPAAGKIRVLTQHFLGPRKSLAIVRVAGESILIGITDQNISMLKTLSLIDDEIPEIVPVDFNASMNAADEKATKASSQAATGSYRETAGNTEANDDQSDDFIIGNIKDKITSTLKNLRPI